MGKIPNSNPKGFGTGNQAPKKFQGPSLARKRFRYRRSGGLEIGEVRGYSGTACNHCCSSLDFFAERLVNADAEEVGEDRRSLRNICFPGDTCREQFGKREADFVARVVPVNKIRHAG